MLHHPARSPPSFLSRFDGGTRRASIRSAASIICSLAVAFRAISAEMPFGRFPRYSSTVVSSPKFRIILVAPSSLLLPYNISANAECKNKTYKNTLSHRIQMQVEGYTSVARLPFNKKSRPRERAGKNGDELKTLALGRCSDFNLNLHHWVDFSSEPGKGLRVCPSP